MWRIVLVLVACGGGHKPPPAAVDSQAECIADDAARAACEQRGEGYRYGSDSVGWCGGAKPAPGQIEEMRQRERGQPCTCVDVAVHQQRLAECSMMP